jgi:2,4-dienoyl-CoA reductase-like NADH-dependent reductase (Old Yellow Enzyme family)
MTIDINTPLTLRCGRVLANRIAKAAMTEALADAAMDATPDLARLYQIWSGSGAALLISGNFMVDPAHLEKAGNAAMTPSSDREGLRRLAEAGREGGAEFWAQINHPGRQSPLAINPEPVAPSAVQARSDIGAFATPRALAGEEVLGLIDAFAASATVARETGFTGVQIHAAHGYLLSQFLSPRVNQRTDEWGGPLQNRARLLLDCLDAVRAAVGTDFPISVKINSSDFQAGGFAPDECAQVVRWLHERGVDLIELSGGNYERVAMIGLDDDARPAPRPSTRAREGYFVEFAKTVRAVSDTPIMLTGGFRTRAGMDAALRDGACDVIGIARPMLTDPTLPQKLIEAGDFTDDETLARDSEPLAGLPWYYERIDQLGRVGHGV